MASSLSSFSLGIKPCFFKCYSNRRPLQVRAHCFRDEGRWRRNMVDENMSVMRERIEEVRIRERLERCCRAEHGWNYAPGYDYKLKRVAGLIQFFELVSMVGVTVGLTFLSGTICLCVVSLLVHLNQ